MSLENKRWEQRFFGFEKALQNLQHIIEKPDFNESDNRSLMLAFEEVQELSWKTLQELLIEGGYSDTHGSRLVIDQSFQLGYIVDPKAWMHMSLNRHLGQEVVLESVVAEVIEEILETYLDLFLELQKKLNTLIPKKGI